TALYNLGQALRTGDVVTVVEALRDGILDVVPTAVRYVPNVVRDIVDSVLEREAQQPPQTSAERLETAGHRSRSDTGPGVTAPASGAPAATPEARPTRAEVTTELTAELTTELTAGPRPGPGAEPESDRKSTRLNSSHVKISYAVFCLKKKKKKNNKSRS